MYHKIDKCLRTVVFFFNSICWGHALYVRHLTPLFLPTSNLSTLDHPSIPALIGSINCLSQAIFLPIHDLFSDHSASPFLCSFPPSLRFITREFQNPLFITVKSSGQ